MKKVQVLRQPKDDNGDPLKGEELKMFTKRKKKLYRFCFL